MAELVLALGIATGTAAFTITRTKITAPLRAWITARSEWLGGLVSCPYCLSHWLAAVAVGIYQPTITDRALILDLGVVWFVVILIATITTGLIGRSMKESLP